MNKKSIFIGVVLIIVLLALGVWIGKEIGSRSASGPSPYSAVYLSTGDIYFGKLSWFPWPQMTNPWFLQRSQNQQLSIAPFQSVFWGPVNRMYLNPKEIVFWTRLRNDSQVVMALTNPSGLEGSENQIPALPPPSNAGVNATGSPETVNGTGR